MPSLLTSLGLGTLLSVVCFVGLYRYLHFNAKKSGFTTVAIVFGIYIPLAIIYWPGGDVFSIHIAIFGIVPYMLGMISHYREQALDQEQRKKWFHWIPALFFLFFFVVVVVNMTLVSLSTQGMSPELMQWILPNQKGETYTSQFPGVISHDYHEKESLYNQYLKRLRIQTERGWKIKQGWLVSPHKNKSSIFQIEARDKAGHIITGLTVSLKFLRPSDYRQDKTFDVKEVFDGIYQQNVKFDLAGHWDVVIMLMKKNDEHEVRGDIYVED